MYILRSIFTVLLGYGVHADVRSTSGIRGIQNASPLAQLAVQAIWCDRIVLGGCLLANEHDLLPPPPALRAGKPIQLNEQFVALAPIP